MDFDFPQFESANGSAIVEGLGSEGSYVSGQNICVHMTLPLAFAERCWGVRELRVGSRNLRGVCRTLGGLGRTCSQNPVW